VTGVVEVDAVTVVSGLLAGAGIGAYVWAVLWGRRRG
jgi:hypothetical protein